LKRLTLKNLNETVFCDGRSTPLGLVWEMEESSGWKRIEEDFGKF
jgi:hypothetical protein